MTTLDERAEAMLQEVEPDASHLVPVSIANLLTTPTPAPPFVVDGLIPRRVVTLLGGHGGAGKSNIGLTLCAYVAGGEHTWAGHRVEDGRALYVSLEDSGEVVRHRLRNIVIDTANTSSFPATENHDFHDFSPAILFHSF